MTTSTTQPRNAKCEKCGYTWISSLNSEKCPNCKSGKVAGGGGGVKSLYDPNVIRKFARIMYYLATLEIILAILSGIAVIGLYGFDQNVPFQVRAAVFLAAAGWVFTAIVVAFVLKLLAQLALCQVQIEENTRP